MDGADRGGRAVQGLHALLAGLPGCSGAPAPPGRPGAPPCPGCGRGGRAPGRRPLDGWGLLPRTAGLERRPCRAPGSPGKPAPSERLEDFLDGPAEEYGTGRDTPGVEGTSRLSAHLRFGEISPFRIWHALRERYGHAAPADVGIFRSELGWREFCWQLLYENPELATRNYRPEFDRFAWQTPSEAELDSLAAGPHRLSPGGRRHAPALADRLDAQPGPDGRREFPGQEPAGRLEARRGLVLGHPGGRRRREQPGELAVGGRIRRRRLAVLPDLQPGHPEQEVRRRRPATCAQYLPELSGLDDKAIHEPWKADGSAAGYPDPVVGLPESRARALETYQRLKDG